MGEVSGVTGNHAVAKKVTNWGVEGHGLWHALTRTHIIPAIRICLHFASVYQ